MKAKGNIFAQLKEGIVPVIVEDTDIESKLFRLSVEYPNGTVKLGNELTPADTIKEPIVEWDAEPNTFYTLLMTDPDAPNRENPIFKEVEHWLVINIPGNKVSEGECLTQYIGPGPPQGTGLHRYIFLLFKQQGKLDVSEDVKPKTEAMKRLNFSTKKLMKKYNLEKIIAGNYFQAQWDTTVPEHILSSPILCTIL